LLDAGHPLEAARILNDEAAIWIKLGDPLRANHLLARSREVFAKLAGVNAVARLELAETEHLLARLLLHANAKPGHERDVLELAVARARAAEAAYKGLEDPQQLGRVWETLARLELRLGHVDTAARLLEGAQQLQREIGDAVGLARSSAAASDVLVATHEYPKALELLSESIELNSQKRLRAGLEFNLASLRQLEAQLPSELLGAARLLERRLGDALSSSGWGRD
jgi:tetratricopeptide (TPR) repeat protein